MANKNETKMSKASNNVDNVNHSGLFKILYGMYYTKIPVMIYGDPGEGKTSTIKFLSNKLNIKNSIISGNKSDPTDINGVRYLEDLAYKDDEGLIQHKKVMKIAIPQKFQVLIDNPDAILFIDEINTCPKMIKNALLGVIQDCDCGEFEIPNSIFRVAAGNYNTISGVTDTNLALTNRFCNIFYTMKLDFFREGVLSDWNNYDVPKINSKDDQVDKEIKYRLALCDFLKQQPDFFKGFPEGGEIVDPLDVSYMTPRSWVNAIKILSVLDSNWVKPDGTYDSTGFDYLKELISGCVGFPAGNAFMKFLMDYKGLGVDMPYFSTHVKEFKLPFPNRMDHVYQIMGTLQYYFTRFPKEYYELWKQVLFVLHNRNDVTGEDNLYGDYPPYDALIIKYLYKNVCFLCNKKNTWFDRKKETMWMTKNLPCWNTVEYGFSSTI
jgi:hypothetical protein